MNTSLFVNLNIPAHLKPGLARYVQHGIVPGSFLSAILRKDIQDAHDRADFINKTRVFEIIQALENSSEISPQIWGSEEKFMNHISKKKKTEASPLLCSCDSKNLFDHGCKCGGS